MVKGGLNCDPKGLIYESYRIANISPEECRTIFLDWALSLPTDINVTEALTELQQNYEDDHFHHPMTLLIRDGLGTTTRAKRRNRKPPRNLG
ncbi:MAG: hypothetical protein OXE94_00965 [Aestuariivita sp.]|nr:hypothetical protein [Aestuariivita sp.]MCY4201031.1 hypothetical protein [Aestuariivita sp.]MCY4287376.1 hypothetical protein [Aestuariivita sp.]MCY4347848.1 hypothetical protein [Aestuariivita sp.]